MKKRATVSIARLLPAGFFVLAFFGPLPAQEPFPAGVEGELYYCPRIDLVPAGEGGPLKIELDGVLDEGAWQRAHFQKWSNTAGNPREFTPVEEDLDLSWAAVADENFLYVAWRVVDDLRQSSETFFCDIWRDDSVEIYLDTLNDGPECPGGASCYGVDDAQISIGADQSGKYDPIDPDALQFGGVAGKGNCDFFQAAPELCRGVVAELDIEDGFPGFQGEIAIALDTLGNVDGEGNPDLTPEWHIQPLHGTTIGWNFHVNDDDDAGERDHKLLWAKKEVTESAWQNPGAFGKLQFIAPNAALVTVHRDLPDNLQNGGSGTVTLAVAPQFGVGTVVIKEELPASMVPSNPSPGGSIAQNTVTWNLGRVESPQVVSYTVAVSADANDAVLPGTATVDGQLTPILGDNSYTGSPISVDGFIKMWNHLGPLGGGMCDPGPDLALDWIVNEAGDITQANISPFPGMITRPKYGGDGLPGGTGARASGLKTRPGLLVLEVVDQHPSWKGSSSPAETIDHSSPQVHGFDADDHVTLSCVYVTNKTGQEIITNAGFGSDDSIQVFVNDEDITFGGIAACRPWGTRTEEQNIAEARLQVGENRILVKVADGGGASGFRLRFQDPDDPTGPGLRPPAIGISLVSTKSPPPGSVLRDFSTDSFALGDIIDVSLTASSPLAAPVEMRVRELLPPGSVPSAISGGGVQAGDAIEWNLSLTGPRTVTYKLSPSPCEGDITFGQSSYKVDPVEGLVSGKSSLRRLVSDELLGTWGSRDIGTTGGAGQPLGEHQVFVSGLGGGVKLTKDEFRFISVPSSGDFEFSARIDCLDDPEGGGLAGLMVRETLDQHSAHAFLALSSTPPAGGGLGTLKANLRRETNPARTSSPITLSDREVTALPIHLRLKRAGGKVFLQRSANGATYTDVATRDIGTGATQINLKDQVLVGLAVTGGGVGTTRAVFGGVSGPSFQADLRPTFRRGDSDGNGQIELTDAVKLLNYLFLGQQKPECVDAADVDDNGDADISDAISNLNYQFLGGTAPAAPGPVTCGPDPSAETPELGCDKVCG